VTRTPSDRGGVCDAAPIPASAGVGLRFPHHHAVRDRRPAVAWFEVHAENYLGEGVAPDVLEAVSEHYPVSLHATGLSLGAAEGIDPAHLAAIAALCARISPGLVSDHLSWSEAGGFHAPDLFPLPYTDEALDVVCSNVDSVQSAFKRTILIENPSVYVEFSGSAMSEAAFLQRLVRRCGCGVLLDVNNVAVSAHNLGETPRTRLAALLRDLPAEAIGEIHLAGHAVRSLENGGQVRIDDHGSRVSAEVWRLFAMAIEQIGPRPTLIEWDTDIPDLAVLQDEAAKAQAILDRAAGSARRPSVAPAS
jgi:uncharacterized protein